MPADSESGLGSLKGTGNMKASQMRNAKRLPPNFGVIDPDAPFDAQRFFAAMAATGNTPYVFYNIDEDVVCIDFESAFPMTKLQRNRLSKISEWVRNKDPRNSGQLAFANDFVRKLKFGPRTEADGIAPRYFRYPLR
jgi:hypothetical protein